MNTGRAWVTSKMSDTDKRGKTVMLGAGDSTRQGRWRGGMGITPHQRAKNKAAQEAADFNDNNDFRSPVRPCLISKKGGRVKSQTHIVPVTSPIKKNTTKRGRDSKSGQEEMLRHRRVARTIAGAPHQVWGMWRVAAPGGIGFDWGAYIYINVLCHGVVVTIHWEVGLRGAWQDKGPWVNEQLVLGTKDYTVCTSLYSSLGVVHDHTHTRTHSLPTSHRNINLLSLCRSMFLCLCLSLLLSVSLCVWMTHQHTHTHSRVTTHIHPHIHTRTHTRTHWYTHGGTLRHTYTHTPTYTHTHTHIHTHTYPLTHIHEQCVPTSIHINRTVVLHMRVVNVVVPHHTPVVGMWRATASGDCGVYTYTYVFCHSVVLGSQEGLSWEGYAKTKGRVWMNNL